MRKSYRKEGFLGDRKRQTIPKHLLFLDTETSVIENDDKIIHFDYKLGVGIYVELDKTGDVKTRKVYTPETKESFVKLIKDLAEKHKHLYVFAHNMGFDLRVLYAFKLLSAIGWDSEPPIINNMVFIYTCSKNKNKISFIDTANLGVRSVDQLGKDMGYDKLEVDFNTVSDEELLTYCIRDTEILERFVLEYIRFIMEHELGAFKVTLASQALTGFRTRFMDESIWIHCNLGAINLERDAYYGGRTEAFRLGYIGEQKYYYIDVNSMYPYVMTHRPMPFQLLKPSDKAYNHPIEENVKDLYVIADVTINTDMNDYPLRLTNKDTEYNKLKNPHNLEYPDSTSKRLIFPTGQFRTTLHLAELQQAVKHGHIVEVHRKALYTTNNPFDDYVKHFYDAKNKYGLEGNKTWRTIAKLFLNSLYGKFGQLQPHRQNQGKQTEYAYTRIHIHDSIKEIHYQELYWNYEKIIEYKQGETAFSNAAISGAITAYARMYLNDTRRLAGIENVYYMDTDSMIVNQEGFDNISHLIDSEKIGRWDIERTSRRLIIHGNKDYVLDGHTKHKGIQKTAIKKSFNLWRFLHFEGFITWWKTGAIGGARGEYRTKRRLGEYYKGIVDNNGIIHPYHLQE